MTPLQVQLEVMTTIHFLAEWALRSSVLIASGALLLQVLRVKDPSIRWAAWTAMLCASLAIPALTPALPKIPLAVMPAPHGRLEGQIIIHELTLKPDRAVSRPDARVDRHSTGVPERFDGARTVPRSDVRVEMPVAAVSNPFNWVRAAVMIYVVVAFGLLLRLCFGLVMSLRLLRSSRVIDRRTEGIEIRESDRVATPVALGIVRPAIVLPGDWREWDGAKLNAVLAHEGSHIRRRDPAVQLLSAIHRALLWHSPLSWFLHRQIVRVAEEASDDAALAVTPDRALYAEFLLEFMQRGVWGASWQGVPVARYGRADQRIHRILEGTALSQGVTRWGLAAILALGLPLAYVVAAAYPEAAPPAQVKIAQAASVQTAEKPPTSDALPVEPAVVDRQDRITGIVFRGNGRIPVSTLRKSISIHPGDIYDPARVESAVTALRNMGYEVREVTSDDPTGTKGGPVVIFYVREKQDAATKPEPLRVNPSTPGSVAQENTTVWVPFTAKKVERYYMPYANGEKTIHVRVHVSTGLVARDSDGSLFTASADGLRGTLLNGRTGDSIDIDYVQKIATLRRSYSPAPLQPPTGEEYKHVPPERSLGTRMISGVECLGIKERASRGDERTTETWVAPSLNYEVIKTTVLDPASKWLGSNKILSEVVLQDIQVGRRPDFKHFRIPEGFQKLYIGPL